MKDYKVELNKMVIELENLSVQKKKLLFEGDADINSTALSMFENINKKINLFKQKAVEAEFDNTTVENFGITFNQLRKELNIEYWQTYQECDGLAIAFVNANIVENVYINSKILFANGLQPLQELNYYKTFIEQNIEKIKMGIQNHEYEYNSLLNGYMINRI